MQYTTIISIDLGQAADPSALSLFMLPIYAPESQVLPLALPRAGWLATDQVTAYQLEPLLEQQPARVPWIDVRDVRRWPLQTKYTQIVSDVWKLLGTLPHAERTAVLIDKTGVGRGVFDMFEESGLAPIGIQITGGAQMTQDGARSYNVPKVDLIGAAQKLLQTKRLRFASQATGLTQLRDELQNFRLKVNLRTGNTSMEAWREKDHDDLVLSVSMACWFILHSEAHHEWTARDMQALAGHAL